MADLKSGSTVGGELILTQGDLPFVPNGNSLFYKNFLVFTENDRPSAQQVDAVSATQGGRFNKLVTFAELTVDGVSSPLKITKGRNNWDNEIQTKQLGITDGTNQFLIIDTVKKQLTATGNITVTSITLDQPGASNNSAVRRDQVVLVGDTIDFGEING
ncbi:hypothetical protein [Providencia phage PSTCR6]|nr:hypothetical protein [Providencia phage PSTCR6]